MKPFKIRDIDIDPPLILSPMAGVTDYTFRRLIKRRGGVGLVVSEFISVEGLTRHNPKSKRQMRFDEEERPFAVQIFGGQGRANGDGRRNGGGSRGGHSRCKLRLPGAKGRQKRRRLGASAGYAAARRDPESDQKGDHDPADA